MPTESKLCRQQYFFLFIIKVKFFIKTECDIWEYALKKAHSKSLSAVSRTSGDFWKVLKVQ